MALWPDTQLMSFLLNVTRAGCAALAIAALVQTLAVSQEPKAPPPADFQFTADGKLQFPANYREWIFLSSGKGMTYGPAANPEGPPQFDNVFVNPAAYRSFLTTGRWPDQSIFILEIRKSKTEGSINKGGYFQGETTALEVLVKDTRRFKSTGGWGFFEFGADDHQSAALLPATATCYPCHAANGAVEFTFVQFYPTLTPIAAKFKTLRRSAAK